MLVPLEAQGRLTICVEVHGDLMEPAVCWVFTAETLRLGNAWHGMAWHENAPKRRQFRETTVEFDACKLNCSLAFASFGPRQHELRDPELDGRAQGAISFPELDRAQEEMRPSRSKRKIDRKSELDGASCQK